MESAINFINFWEKQQCNGKYYDAFNNYIRFLRGSTTNAFFDDLYNIYIKEHNLEYNKKQYDVCKFLANEYYDDLAAGTYEFNVWEGLKNYAYYGA